MPAMDCTSGASPRGGDVVSGMEHVHLRELKNLNVPLTLDMDGGEALVDEQEEPEATRTCFSGLNSGSRDR
jgi:hypothetical protein